MNNLEKLITDLSNYWDLSPEKVVDRLNHMDESEIKNVVGKMTKKFQKGGFIDCLREGGSVDKCKCGKTIKAQDGTKGLYTGPVREGEYRPKARISNVPEYWRDEEDAEFGIPMSGYTLPIKSKYSSVFKYDESEHAVATKPYGLLGIEHVYGDDVDKLFNSLEQKRKNWESDPYRLQNMLNEWGKKFAFSPKKHQAGGTVSGRIPRSSMFNAAFEYAPEVFENKSDVRTAYKTAKNIGREQGLRGRDLRQFGKNMVIDKSYANADGDVTPHVPLPPNGKVARSTMFDTAKEFTPQLTRKDVRGAYGIAKDWGRDAGLHGGELRQYARNKVIDKMYNYADSSPVNTSSSMPKLPVLDNNIVIEDEPIVINDNLFTNLDSSLPTVGLMGSFNKAFRQARNRGLDKFYYNGPDKKAGWFTTELDKSKQTSTPSVDLSTRNTATQGGAIPTTGGWIAGPGYDPRVTQILAEEWKNRAPQKDARREQHRTARFEDATNTNTD